MGVRLTMDRSIQTLAQLEARVEQVLELGASITQQEAVRSIQSGGRSGRIYDGHQASAPGEPPANQTGALAASILIERPSRLRRRVTVGELYGAILELRKSRPFLLPAFYASVGPMRAMLRQIQSAGGWRSAQPLRRSIHYASKVRPR
jgi:hypothetical protein